MTRFGEIGRKVVFGQKWPFLTKIRPKTPKQDFWAKPENVTSVALGSPNFVPKIRKLLMNRF